MDAVKVLLLLTAVGFLLCKDVSGYTSLLLVDYWDGMEERTFTYEKGVQVWQ